MALLAGDNIRIMCDGTIVDGVIEMISKNEASMLIHFGTIIHNHVGSMPISRGEDGVYRSIIDGTEVFIKKQRCSK